MRTTLARRAALILALSASLAPAGAGAQDPSPVGSPVPLSTPLTTLPITSPLGRWSVDAFDPWGEGMVKPRDEGQLIVSFLADGQLEGNDGCGRFLGGWSLVGDGLRLGLTPTGYVGCSDARTEVAAGLGAALTSVVGWRTTSSGLELLDERGDVRLALVDAHLSPVGAWTVVHYRRPNGRLVEPLANEPMWLELEADGQAHGSTGCRLLEGAFTLDGSAIIIDPLDTVGLPCEGDTRRAERQLLRAFGEAIYWVREGDTLRLTDGFDETIVELVVRADVQAPPVPGNEPSGSSA